MRLAGKELVAIFSKVNRHNYHYWSKDDPLTFCKVHSHDPQRVWAATYKDYIKGPFFSPGTYFEQID